MPLIDLFGPGLAERARRLVEERFTWAQVADDTDAVYDTATIARLREGVTREKLAVR